MAILPPVETKPVTAYISFSAEINQPTTEGLLAAVGELVSKGVKTIYLLLSTSGGNVMNGVTIYNVLRSLPITLILLIGLTPNAPMGSVGRWAGPISPSL